jgi:hypothetical protein
MPSTCPPRRLLRSAVAAGTATVLGTGGHVLAGGSVGTGMVAAAVVVATGVAWSAAGRERGTSVIAALQVGLQQLVHTLLTAGDVPAPDGILPHDLMLHVHVAAGLLTALVLRAGERRTWAAARRVAARVATWCRRIVLGRRRRTATLAVVSAPALRVRPQHRFLRHALVLRGPPTATV